MTSSASCSTTATGFAPHDHAGCVQTGLEIAQARCAQEGLRLTPVRRKVLEVLLQEHRALGAYAILDLLRAAGFASQPPVAYRALEFLTSNGFAHKIERLNAFVACAHPSQEHAPTFMICRICETVAEAPAVLEKTALEEIADTAGFRIEKAIIEAEGICPTCAG